MVRNVLHLRKRGFLLGGVFHDGKLSRRAPIEIVRGAHVKVFFALLRGCLPTELLSYARDRPSAIGRQLRIAASSVDGDFRLVLKGRERGTRRNRREAIRQGGR